jgi:hypothetical protein
MAAINRAVLLKELRDFDLSSVESKARKEAEKEINRLRLELVEDFSSHPVTLEIENGADATNESLTLNGIGNLTTYIGFSPGDNPTQPVKEILNTVAITSSEPKKKSSASDITFEFDVIAPSIEEIENVGKLPFEQGNSWIKGIESGISGFGAYIYGKMFKNSRSGKGLQSRTSFRQGAFRPVKYMSEIMNRFYSKIK